MKNLTLAVFFIFLGVFSCSEEKQYVSSHEQVYEFADDLGENNTPVVDASLPDEEEAEADAIAVYVGEMPVSMPETVLVMVDIPDEGLCETDADCVGSPWGSYCTYDGPGRSLCQECVRPEFHVPGGIDEGCYAEHPSCSFGVSDTSTDGTEQLDHHRTVYICGGCDNTISCEAGTTCYRPPTSGMFGFMCALDSDDDEVADIEDNCPHVANEDQLDEDRNGLGDVCETVQMDISWFPTGNYIYRSFGDYGIARTANAESHPFTAIPDDLTHVQFYVYCRSCLHDNCREETLLHYTSPTAITYQDFFDEAFSLAASVEITKSEWVRTSFCRLAVVGLCNEREGYTGCWLSSTDYHYLPEDNSRCARVTGKIFVDVDGDMQYVLPKSGWYENVFVTGFVTFISPDYSRFREIYEEDN